MKVPRKSSIRPRLVVRRNCATLPFLLSEPAMLPLAMTVVRPNLAATRFRNVSPSMPSTLRRSGS